MEESAQLEGTIPLFPLGVESLAKILERIKLNSAISKIINGNGNLSQYGHGSVD